MSNETHIYASPDLRKQTIVEAETFLSQKRAKRLVLVQSFKEKTETRLATLKGKELDLFTSRVERVRKLGDKVVEALRQYQNALDNLSSSNSNIANIENQERLL